MTKHLQLFYTIDNKFMGIKSKNNPSQSKQTESRKDSHLALAMSSQNEVIDSRFYYEPILASHPDRSEEWIKKFGKKEVRFPLWISSMTGGTSKTNEINLRLAKAAKKYGLGMGVGSARIALEGGSQLEGFDLRPIIGDDLPLYLNFGIAQIELMLQNNTIHKISELVNTLKADGVIIHVNPLQEWLQPEGDFIQKPPIDTIKEFLASVSFPLIVKEVGQGMGYESLKSLLQLPLTAIEFAANGGTNFSKLELLRNKTKSEFLMPFVYVGHSAEEMVEMCNQLVDELGNLVKCQSLIISGGIKDFLDGYYLMEKSKLNAIYGQASGFLTYAEESQEALDNFIEHQIEGLLVARKLLKIKEK
ncbi:MAG TPA: hypothetical protein VKX31_05520 [Brumimicrobium sp.]|nr:hypothetical protein [Brumimicrobium sp.]